MARHVMMESVSEETGTREELGGEQKELAAEEGSFPSIIIAEAFLALVQTIFTVALLIWANQRPEVLALLPFR